MIKERCKKKPFKNISDKKSLEKTNGELDWGDKSDESNRWLNVVKNGVQWRKKQTRINEWQVMEGKMGESSNMQLIIAAHLMLVFHV